MYLYLIVRIEVNEMKQCSLCGEQVQAYLKNRSICRNCKALTSRLAIKLAAIAYKGNKCVKCGIQGHPAIYSFHHRNPIYKDFDLSDAADRSWDIVKVELDKCDLLCDNCHNIEHARRYSEAFLEYTLQSKLILQTDFYLDWIESYKKSKLGEKIALRREIQIEKETPKNCLWCNKLFNGRVNAKFCSTHCCYQSQNKVARPSKEQLEEKIKTMSWVAIGREYGVSDNAVRNWAKKYGLPVKRKKNERK